jgi:hypothetical protein
MELLGFAALFVGLALIAALPLVALLALAEWRPRQQSRHDR